MVLFESVLGNHPCSLNAGSIRIVGVVKSPFYSRLGYMHATVQKPSSNEQSNI